MLVALLAKVACVVLGYLYPSYRAYRALKYVHGPNTELEVLAVVCICASFEVACTTVFDPVLGPVFPLYYLGKVFFAAWLAAPSTRGAWWLYSERIEPYFEQLVQDLNEAFGRSRTNGSSQVTVQNYGQRW